MSHHAHLGLKEDVQDLDAGGISKDLEELRQIVEDLLVGHIRVHLFHDLLMDVEVRALLQLLLFRHKLTSKTNI